MQNDNLKDQLQKSGISNENIEVLVNQLEQPTEEIPFKIANFSSFTIKNPVLMTLKQAREYKNSLYDISVKFFGNVIKENEQKKDKNKNDKNIDVDLGKFSFNDFETEIFKIAEKTIKICGKQIDLSDENNDIYQLDGTNLYNYLMAVLTYYNYKKNS